MDREKYNKVLEEELREAGFSEEEIEREIKERWRKYFDTNLDYLTIVE